jgi:hypothetical protein
MTAISCSPSSFCMAVTCLCSGGGPSSEAESWNGGRLFKDQPSAGNLNGGLDGVSCTSGRFCLAVGLEQGDLAAQWNGTAWRQVRSGSALDAVSCLTPDDCVGVGYSPVGSVDAEGWNGVNWTPQRTPRIKSRNNPELNAVSCSSESFCAAVGFEGRNPLALMSAAGAEIH